MDATRSLTAGEIASALSLGVSGDPSRRVSALAPFGAATADDATFVDNEKLAAALPGSSAGVVIVHPRFDQPCSATRLLSDNPRLDYARLTQLLYPLPAVVPGVHPSASVADTARIDATACIGAHAVVEAGARVGARCSVGPQCFLGAGVVVGDNTRLHPRVTLCEGVSLGRACTVHSGAVVGADGFGFAPDRAGQWHKVRQLGSVRVGDNVDIGANTTIDRGAIDDTVIADGVILDNQIQIGHNVVIGEHSALAGCTGVAGSTRIGKRVQIGGHSAILGHLEICDGVVLLGHSVVSGSISTPGVYSSVMPVLPVRVWRRLVARFRRLDRR
ncbi:MAG: UDP-3-O-(3-hydroxymyristoyl)glucosamine N-acyltransferase [Pseudomonadota bacterium]